MSIPAAEVWKPEMADEGEDGSGSGSLWLVTGKFMGHGLTWALSVLLFLLLGWWVDGKVGTTPLFMILGAFVGAGAGFYSLYHHITEDSRPSGRGQEEGERREP